MIPSRREENRRRPAARGVWLALIGLLLWWPTQTAAEEPISLELLLDGVPSQEGGWVLTVTLLARTDLDQAGLTVETSPGLKRTAGAPHWQGALPAGGERVLELSFTMTAPPPQTVTLRVQGRTKSGVPFERKVVRKIN